ncbi:restriction endonuclease subunit S [Enterococcus faecalis]|nr:restriction endonuclease subunit S [Enterococcus faecalis]
MGEVSEIRTGPFGSTLHAEDYVKDGFPIITTEHFKNGELPESKDNVPQVSAEDYNRLKSYTLNEEDIVFSRVGSVDLNALVSKAQSRWLFSGRVLRVRSNNRINSQYLHYELSTTRAKNDVISRAVGQTMPSINTEILKSTSIYFPKFTDEQYKIGVFFKKLDDTITLHQRKLEQLKDLKKAYLQAMFPGKDERVPKLRFADFEEEWELRKIKDLGEIQTGNTPSTQIEDNYSNDGTLWVTPTDIDSLIIRDTAKKLSDVGLSRARIAKPGSILITSIASIGKNSLTLTDVGFNQQINSLTPSVDNDSYFLLTQSEKWSKEMRQKAASGTMQIVNKTEFSNITTNTPNLKEQQKIGIFFKKLDQSITLYKNKLNQLKALKKAYLQNMFI